MTGSTQALDTAFLAEQLRLHRSIASTSVAGAALLAATMAWTVWGSVDASRLLAWLAVLVLALLGRLTIAALHRRATADAATSAAWLRRYRISFAVHGLVWCLAGTLLLPAASPAAIALLLLVFVAVASGALLATSFDVTAAVMFGVPALTPPLFHVVTHTAPGTPGVGVAIGVLVPIALLSAIRSQRAVHETVRLRIAEAGRADEARRAAEDIGQAKRALAEQNHLFNLLLRTTTQGYWFIDTDGRTVEVNAAMCALLGRPEEQVAGRSVFEFFTGIELQRLNEQLAARLRGEVGAYEITIVRPDGSRVDCVNNATPIFDTDGKRLGSVGLWTDITARRQAEAALRVYELVANAINDIVSVVGEDRVYRMVNDEWCRRVGVSRADALGRRMSDVAPGLSTPERREALRECIELGKTRVVRGAIDSAAMAGGHFETTYFPHTEAGSNTRMAVIVTRDVTEQETTRLQLATSAEYLRRTLNATGDAIFAVDASNQHVPVRFVNDQMLQMWGLPADRAASLTPAEIKARARDLLIDPDAEERRIDEIVAANEPRASRLYLRDGRVLLQRCIPARVSEHNLRVWSFRDITTEERALQLALSSEAEQRALLDAFPGFIARQDANLVYSYVNAPLAARLGFTPEQMIGHSAAELLGPERAVELRALFERALAGERITYERVHADGSTDQATMAVGFDPRNSEPTVYTFGIDITTLKRAEQRLRAASELLGRKSQDLQVTLDSIAQGIVGLDADGRVGVYNRRALELLDLPESLMTPGVTYDDVVRFQVQRGDLARDASFIDVDGERRHFKGGRAASPDVYVRRTRAGYLVEVRTRQLPDGGMVRTFADVTAYVEAQQALREQQDELSALLAAFPGVIASLDQGHRYSYVNERLAEILGKPAAEIVGRHLRDVVGEERFRIIAHEIKRADAGERVVGERSYFGTAGRPRLDLEVTHVAGPMQNDGRRTYYMFGQDVTARKCAEAALTVARDEAQRANRAKSLFLSHMSHELRTPMNAILGFGQLLASDAERPLAAAQLGHVEEILRGARHLLDLINESLDLGRIEAGELAVERVPVLLAELIEDCLGLMHPLARAHNVQLRAPRTAMPGEQVWADRTRLKQVLLNLLANAIKYNRPAGSVDIVCNREGDAVRIAVHDSGRGLGVEEQQRLFQPFERLSAARSDIEGTGIGLALSQRLVHAMGGDIGAESELGRGSTFWLRLPRARAAAPAPGGGSAAALPRVTTPEGVERTVLYIEDNPVNVILMQAMLARLPGVRTLVATLPQQGLELTHEACPDLVLLDIQLPGMDGFEVLERLRASERTRAIPVIAVSANAMPADIEAGLAAGFADYLTKPLELERLLAAVTHVLGAPTLP